MVFGAAILTSSTVNERSDCSGERAWYIRCNHGYDKRVDPIPTGSLSSGGRQLICTHLFYPSSATKQATFSASYKSYANSYF